LGVLNLSFERKGIFPTALLVWNTGWSSYIFVCSG